MKKRVFILFLAALLLLLPACSRDKFDYLTSDITKYYDIDLSEITGGSYSINLSPEITEEDAWRELRRLQLYYAKHNGGDDLDQYLTAPQFGDEAMIYYDIALTPDGEGLVSNLFSEDGAHAVLIGLWEFPDEKLDDYNPILDSRELSDALTQQIPASRVTEGVVEFGDIIVIDFDWVDSSNVLDREKSKAEVRIDTTSLALYENMYPKALLDALVGKKIGEEFSVPYSYTPEGAKEPISGRYQCIVTHKLLEGEYDCLAIDVPKDTFDKDYSEQMQSFNGKTAYLRYKMVRYIDYSVPELGPKLYVDILGLKTEETDPHEIEKIAVQQIVMQLTETRLLQEIYPQVTDVIMDKLFERDDRVKKLPKALYKKEYKALVDEVTDAYQADKAKAASEGKKFPYSNIDDYSAYYYDYDPSLFRDMEAFCKDEARYQLTLRLAIFGMAQVAGIRYSKEESDELFATYMEYQSRYFTQNGVSLTQEELELLHRDGKATNGEKRYAEYVQLVIKFYRLQNVNLTAEQVAEEFGTKEELTFRAVFQAMQIEVMEYVFKNNEWTNKTN